jgi:hypothetical protein
VTPVSHVTTTKPTGEDRRVALSLDNYLTAVRATNPFAANRITEPSDYDVDVAAIHGAEFDRLVVLAGQAMPQRTGVGVALLGGAGVGKSHLLSRLYRWANDPAAGGGPRACFAYLHNILADPERLPRYLLKYVISRLSEGGREPLHQTPLYRFVDRAMRHALESAGVKAEKLEGKLKKAVDAYRNYFGKSVEHQAAYDVLYQFWRFARPEKAHEQGRRSLALAALSWLAGDEIDPTFAAGLGFKTDAHQPVMLKDDQDVMSVLTALTRLAFISGQPFILCVDQVENLDPEKLKPLARFLHALLDHASNLLVITSGVRQTLIRLNEEDVIPDAAWDRIAQYKVDLRRVPRQDARKILEARLERFHEAFVAVDEVRQFLHEDTLFPLSREWLETQLSDAVEFRPRDILTRARDAWDERQAEATRLGGEAWIRSWSGPITTGGKVGPGKKPPDPAEIASLIDSAVDRKIAEHVSQLCLQPGSLPPDAGNLAGLVESLLGQCQGEGLPYTLRGVERTKKKGTKLPPHDLLIRERREPDGREITTGVLFVTNIGLSATAALRRLLEDDKPPNHRLLVTDHERRPLKVGTQGVEYYKDLEKLGPGHFEHLKIDFELYAALDALLNVVGLARSGDLEIEAPPGTPRPVSEVEVVASHHRRDRYLRHPLLRPLLTEEEPLVAVGPSDAVSLDEKDVRQYVMAQLAWMMGSTAQAIAKSYIVVKKDSRLTYEAAWPQVKTIAGLMHGEGLIHATPQDDDLFLLLRKSAVS